MFQIPQVPIRVLLPDLFLCERTCVTSAYVLTSLVLNNRPIRVLLPGSFPL